MYQLPLAILHNWGFAVAGLACMAIPIIIHLLNRRRFKTVIWAAMEYLLQAMRKNRRRLRFEQWLLLATRCALLGLLGLALARPTGCEQNPLGVGKGVGLHVIIVDNALSMAYDANRPNARTHFDQAKLIARRLIDIAEKGGGNDAVTIIATSGLDPNDPKRGLKASALFANPTYDMDSARAALDRLEQSYGQSDITGALELALTIGRAAESQTRRTLYIVSDATQADWGEKSPRADLLRRTGPDLAKVFRKPVFYNLGRADQWNVAAMGLDPSANLVTTKFPIDWAARVEAFGPAAAAQLEWLIDGKPDTKPDGVSRVNLGDRSRSDAIISRKIEQGGVHVIAYRLQNEDALKVDNVRYRVVDVASELKVLIVEGERGVGALESSGSFLELALAPPKEAAPGAAPTPGVDKPKSSDASYVSVELITDDQLATKVIGDYRAVILTNVSQVSAGEAERIEKFVSEGGTLMLFMGEQVKGDLYNSILLPRKLLPGKLVARKTDASADGRGHTFDFNPKGNVHAFLRAFRDLDNTGLNTARVFTYYQCELAPGNGADVVLNYAGENSTKDPAITVHTLGKGRVVFFSTTANCDWTSFPAKPAYPALVHELLAGTINVGDKWMNLEVGQPLEIPPLLRLTVTPTLRDPTERDVPIEAVSAGDGLVAYRSKPLVRPGVHRLNAGSSTYFIAVNVPVGEADIRTLKEPQIRKALGDIDLGVAGDGVPTEVAAADERNDFSWIMMCLVLAMAGVECLMAMRFGHYRRSGVNQGPAAGTATQAA